MTKERSIPLANGDAALMFIKESSNEDGYAVGCCLGAPLTQGAAITAPEQMAITTFLLHHEACDDILKLLMNRISELQLQRQVIESLLLKH